MNVFVAGASGAIGQPLIAELLRKGHAVTGMTRSEAGAKRLRGHGADIAFVDAFDEGAVNAALRASGAEAVIDELTAIPKMPSQLPAHAAADRLYDRIRRDAGHLDIVFANAGGGEFLPLTAVTEQHVEQTFATNVKGTLFTVQKALPLLKDGGAIVLMSSTAGSTGNASFSVYGASKAAVRSFARSWLLELKARRIRVNVLSPGSTITPGLLALAPPEQREDLVARLTETIPLGRMAEPREIAEAALFLASDAASFVNGVELFADGGSAQI